MPKRLRVAIGFLAILLIALPWVVNAHTLQLVILTITNSMLGLAFASSMRVGLPRFDAAAWWGVGAYTTAVLMKIGMSFWLALAIGGITAVILGWIIFAIAVPRGMIVFLLFGIVVVMAFRQLFGSLQFFGGWGGTGVIPSPTIGSFSIIAKRDLYYMGLFFLGLNLVVYYLIYDSRIGRAWNAIGSSTRLAHSIGIDVVTYRMANVLIGNFFLALAGSYYLAYSLVTIPEICSLHNSIYAMAYAIVGGISYSLTGPIVGSALITFLSEYLHFTEELEPIITSVILMLIIILLPKGVLSLIDINVRPLLTLQIFKEIKG